MRSVPAPVKGMVSVVETRVASAAETLANHAGSAANINSFRIIYKTALRALNLILRAPLPPHFRRYDGRGSNV